MSRRVDGARPALRLASNRASTSSNVRSANYFDPSVLPSGSTNPTR
jgi:hypothetical protein